MSFLGRLLWACVAVWFFAGCATDGVTMDRCNTGRVIDGCSPADLPPLIHHVPWPFPQLFVPIDYQQPEPPKEPPKTAPGRLLEKLGK